MRIELRWCALLAVSVMAFGAGCETTRRDGATSRSRPEADAPPTDAGPDDAKTAAAEASPRPEPARRVAPVMAAGPDARAKARKILSQTGVKGGLVVHIGCGDGKLTASLRANDRYLVQGLDADEGNVKAARANIVAAGAYGKVSVDRFDGKSLPYVDNFVNLIVSDDPGAVPVAEIMRALCPNGVAYIKGKKTVKPWPKEMDEWTHYMHDPQGSCVGKDTLVGPPRRMRWVGSPRHARSHEHTASLHALVSAKGRIFDVTDMGSRASIQLPSKYTLTARDGFNGTILWKREIPDWFNHLYPLKSGPGYMPRRLVAVGEVVYVSGGIGHKLLALDAATGKVLREYAGTATTVDLIVSGGVIFAVVDSDRKKVDYNQQNDNCWREQGRASGIWAWKGAKDVIKAIDAGSGRVMWESEMPAAPMTLAADGGKVCIFDGRSVVALDRRSGKEMWKSEALGGGAQRRRKPKKGQESKKPSPAATASAVFRTGYAPKLVIHDTYVLYSPFGKIVALDGKTGKTLWNVRKPQRSGHFSPEDLYVIDGTIWAAGTARGRGSTFGGYDLATGEMKKKNQPRQMSAFIMHQRCYPGRATVNWLLGATIGTEFIDPKTGEWEIHHWVRGGCVYGIMPANGLLYATPQACACYYQSKLNGFNALAAGERRLPETPTGRLEKGKAYGSAGGEGAPARASDWPTFRHDNERSGFAKTDVPSGLKQSWKVRLGGRVSQPVVADGKLFVSAIDEHTVHALDAGTGKKVWRYIAGGRVDSPPTIYKGLAIFGCADGHIYALRASDGELAWRFRAAPVDQRLMSYEQIESVWPVHGSTLIQNDILFCVAGRSMFLDGGLRMIRLKPLTGELISENVMGDKIPGTDKNLQTMISHKHMPVALPDVLCSDGRYVYMKSQTFDMEGKRTRVAPQKQTTQAGEESHLFSPISLLDGSWFHRSYWIYGRAAGEGWAEWQIPGKYAPYGRIMCFAGDDVFAYARDPEYLCNSSLLEYRLYSAKKQVKPGKAVGSSVTWKSVAKNPEERLTKLQFNWKVEHPPVIVRAMVLAGETLFVAGPPDVVDEKKMWGHSNEDMFVTKMREQVDALEGKQGGVLWAVSTKDGTKLSELKLESLPAFDGMIAAGGRIYLSTTDGKVLCMGEGR
ncbi:MAG: outer membrane protein assembly factor BamB family protein [Planctomycetota bacterium]|jgi:outer membrane protein assembly factor BamB